MEKHTALGTKTTGWTYGPQAEEFSRLSPDRALMQRLATDTNGQMLALDDIAKLPEMLKNIRVPIEVTLSTPLWHTPWIFLALLLLIGAEWFLRRKGGMA